MPINKTRRIAKDYYHSELTLKEIGKKHKIKPSGIYSRVNDIDANSVRENKFNSVIKVKYSELYNIVEILEALGIEHEVPQDFELIEKFESKINK